MTALFSSQSSDWETPPAIYAALDRRYHFTLDVCASPETAKCARYYDQATDGLAQPWNGRVWCNPPYGRGVGNWLAKGHDELDTHICELAVFLLPARTDTQWFHAYLWDGSAHHPRTGVSIEFMAGRLRFVGGASSAPFPSMIACLRSENSQKDTKHEH